MAEGDLEEVQGERSAKYRELRKREDTIKGEATPLNCTWEEVQCIYAAVRWCKLY